MPGAVQNTDGRHAWHTQGTVCCRHACMQHVHRLTELHMQIHKNRSAGFANLTRGGGLLVAWTPQGVDKAMQSKMSPLLPDPEVS